MTDAAAPSDLPPDAPWSGDACSLVDAFRAGERSPLEELDATLAAVDASALNAFSFLDVERARDAAASADVSLPFGGVPTGIKEVEAVDGWPLTHGSKPLADARADHDATSVRRLRDAGSVFVGLTTMSEFGGVNLTRTVLNGATRNPWGPEHTPGGSSGGSAAAVAGGLVTIASAGDGGGSTRIPAGFCGLLGFKGTFGRIPRGPRMAMGSLTVVKGCVTRSVRDTARWLDVCNGFDARDPLSLPRVDGWERDLGTLLADGALRGRRVAIAPSLGAAVVHPDVEEIVRTHGEALARDAGLEVVDVDIRLPELGFEWAMAGMGAILANLRGLYPDCADDLTPEIKLGLELGTNMYDLQVRARIDARRTKLNEAMADIFDDVDFVIAATNPDVAFGADGPLPTKVGDVDVLPQNNGALTIPSNIYGNPAVSIPVGTSRGLPVGMQVIAEHFEDAALLDLARCVERERPWPLVAPGVPQQR